MGFFKKLFARKKKEDKSQNSTTAVKTEAASDVSAEKNNHPPV